MRAALGALLAVMTACSANASTTRVPDDSPAGSATTSGDAGGRSAHPVTPDHAAWDESDVSAIDGEVTGASVEGAYTVLRVAVDPRDIAPLTQDWVGYVLAGDGRVMRHVKLEIIEITSRGFVRARHTVTDVEATQRVRFFRAQR